MRRMCLALAFSIATLLAPSWIIAGDGDQNTQIARQIIEVMRDHGGLENEALQVRCGGGVAYILGTVHTEQQRAAAIEIAKACPDVHQVISQLQIFGGAGEHSTVRVAGLTQQDAALAPQPAPSGQRFASGRAMPVPMGMSALGGAQSPPGMRLAQMPQMGMEGQGMPQPAYVPGAGGGPARAAYDQPHMPGYAWPSYASYPNYAALTYPKQYSPTAWPYIGPFYPYPQVPLGWRKVTLRWNDGWWFLDFKD